MLSETHYKILWKDLSKEVQAVIAPKGANSILSYGYSFGIKCPENSYTVGVIMEYSRTVGHIVYHSAWVSIAFALQFLHDH